MAEKIEISKDGYLKLVEKVFQNKLEERELALDRYRKADEQMETAEQFALIGKNAVSFLSLASLSTNELAALAKEIKSIVYKGDTDGEAGLELPDGWKEAVAESIDGFERSQKARLIEEIDKD